MTSRVEADPLAPVDEFLAAWKSRMMETVPALYRDYKAEWEQIFHDKSMDGWQKGVAYKMLATKYGRMVVDFGVTAIYHPDKFGEILDKECAKKKTALIERATKKIGGIETIEWLTVGGTGELEGYVSGPEGRLHLHSVLAGGYNVQCLHVRFLMNKIRS